jgi:L-ribulose-5-phosphate 3-epimerase
VSIDPRENVVGASPNCFLGFDPFVAYRQFPRVGIHHVEVPSPPSGMSGFAPEVMGDAGIQAFKERLASLELAAISVGAYCDMLTERHQQLLLRRIDFAQQLGAGNVVTDATRQLELDADGWRRLVNALRFAGDYAADRGVRIALETHGGITRNGALARRLLDDVDHPAVGVNYDTGNIYYYNEGLDPVEDVRQVADRIVQVHLKDTEGGVDDWLFPGLGEGRVDFPAIIGILQEAGFKGPYSLEIEGRRGEDFNRAQHLERLQHSMDYLRRIGLVPPT